MFFLESILSQLETITRHRPYLFLEGGFRIMRGRGTKWTLLFAGFIFFFPFLPFLHFIFDKADSNNYSNNTDYFNLKEEAEGELDLPFHCLLEMKLKNNVIDKKKTKKNNLKRMFLKYKHDDIVFGESLL